LKYIGSKARFAPEICAILQDYIYRLNIKTYIEPFVGGFNIIDKIKCKTRIGNDIDSLVCDLVTSCRNDPSLLRLATTPTRDKYYDVRDNPAIYQNWYRAAILLFGSYNARVYGGCYGATSKTKDGKTRNYFEEAKNNFIKQLPSLDGILISCCDYKYIVPPSNETALIYCDPPYADGIGYNSEFDAVEFWEWCRRLSEKHIVIISERAAPDDFVCIWQQETKSHLNNRAKKAVIEKLFIHRLNYGENH